MAQCRLGFRTQRFDVDTICTGIMKRNLIPVVVCVLALLLSIACSRPSGGELVGVKRESLKTSRLPHGMVFVPGGTFIMGQSDEDITFSQIAQNRQVTISSCSMDDSEISNIEYPQFVNWVRHSILIYNYLGDDSYFVDVEGTGERYIDWNKVHGGRRSLWST